MCPVRRLAAPGRACRAAGTGRQSDSRERATPISDRTYGVTPKRHRSPSRRPCFGRGFYERAPAPWNECRKAGAPAPAAKAFRALRGCEGSDRRLPQSWGPSFFYRDAGFHAGRGAGRAGKTERGSSRHKAGRRRDGKADAGFHTGRNIGRAEAEGESGRHKAGGGTGKRMRVFTQAGKRQAERAASRETGKGPKRGWASGRIGKIRPAGQMLRPIKQPCARKGEKQPAGRRMRFSLYRFVL